MKSRDQRAVLPRVRYPKSAYLERLLELYSQGAIQKGRITHVNVRHSKGCGFFVVGVCSCRPDLELFPEVA